MDGKNGDFSRSELPLTVNCHLSCKLGQLELQKVLHLTGIMWFPLQEMLLQDLSRMCVFKKKKILRAFFRAGIAHRMKRYLLKRKLNSQLVTSVAVLVIKSSEAVTLQYEPRYKDLYSDAGRSP